MNHETIKEKLFSHFDGALAPEETLEVERHLEGCAECRDNLSEWREIRDAAFPERYVAAPLGFADRVMARLAEEAPARAWWRRWMDHLGFAQPFGQAAWAGGFALAAALVLWGPVLQERRAARNAVPPSSEMEMIQEPDLWQDINLEEDSSDLGTGIEEYFL